SVQRAGSKLAGAKYDRVIGNLRDSGNSSVLLLPTPTKTHTPRFGSHQIFFALLTGVQGLISSGFVNENHFGPSAWRRSFARGTQSPKGTDMDAYFVGRGDYVDIIFENIGPPSCTNHSKHHDDKEKTWRNAADALLERYYISSGSFEIAKGYKIVYIIVFGHDDLINTVSILNRNEYLVQKVFQDKYHVRRD
ncbi:hypothetical protein BGX27_003015, partial [Mortierella sp. AM989]